MTVGDLLTATLKLIGAIAKSEQPSADESADALARLQDMIDAWAADRLMIYSVTRSLYPLVSGTQTYSIGPGATFNQVRPMWIENAGIISNNNPLQPLELPMAILSTDQWAGISIKNVATSLAWYLYYDYAFNASGWGNLNVWPIPNVSTLQIALYTPIPLTSFAALADTILLPPGFAEALRYNLAVRLAPEFGMKLEPVIYAIAQEGLARIERANKRLYHMGIDPALYAASSARIFNYLTGTSTGGSGGA